METEKVKDVRYCGTKDVCFYKEPFICGNECLAYKTNKDVWVTCPHKWKWQGKDNKNG